ncbi:bifunctional pantoate--beta-alanine ligase/(d)CMP kinase [Candidatus Synechococcus calcipolaris G9]|uniref:Bifunctional pantoate ligase/cytidylate kinase n=1 Tax=Candidatus Synechococcus calcipolaris G9 TaxID=1497997 RepID=A0ABT6EVK5_9SYNE|nr:bifunctional pantoate--beta-alanine ligase/(d)CMP kinase [Candidatus Synechococcus calcipolaris]MDG2989831.1 bifunctional pantoate--beta-alanine ligase/(d)CMP kinase [Candidatus Synechococcus calcipolaris G9]
MAELGLIKTLAGLACALRQERSQRQSLPSTDQPFLGFVPTMGALHRGHLSLIERARQDCQRVLVSIFVNPLQFGPQEDLATYPRSLDQDYNLCCQAGVDWLFVPTIEELYPHPSAETTLVHPPRAMVEVLCGRSRPGHFAGVITIVLKLLNLIAPDRAYFGEKDAQQIAIIRRCLADLNQSTEIIPCPIVREASGLALSSRNQYLSAPEKQQATALCRSLHRAQRQFQQGITQSQGLIETVQTELAREPAIAPEYIELVHPDTLVPLQTVETVGLLAVAARIGTTRLIDNCQLDLRPPILAIDGPAGAGKSTVTRLAAKALGLTYLDTGAMYRAVTWWCLQADIDLGDGVQVVEQVGNCQIKLHSTDPLLPPQVWINDQEVTESIRSQEVTAQVSRLAAIPEVRQRLVKQQQAMGAKGGIAAEGRDIGTHVFPDAGLKIFLTASPQERAKRRWQELQQQDTDISLDDLTRQIMERDYNDSQRAYAPFRKAADAIEVSTDGLTIEAVTEKIVHLYRNLN